MTQSLQISQEFNLEKNSSLVQIILASKKTSRIGQMDLNNNNSQETKVSLIFLFCVRTFSIFEDFLFQKRRSSGRQSINRKSVNLSPAIKKETAKPFKASGHFELTKNATMWAIKFSKFITDADVFAVTSGSRIMVFQCSEIGVGDSENNGMELLNCFKITKDSPYALDWSYDATGAPIILAGGEKGLLYVVKVKDGSTKQLLGHSKLTYWKRIKQIIIFHSTAGAINEIKTHPKDHDLVGSVSEDHTARLWNISTSVCILKFSGGIHASHVLSLDFDPKGTFISTCGKDHIVAFWSLQSEAAVKAIESSKTRTDSSNVQKFRSLEVIDVPIFSTKNVHNNWIDSVISLEDGSMISRSLIGDIVWWKRCEDKILKIRTLITKVPQSQRIWFVRLSIDSTRRFLALGDLNGAITLWDLKSETVSSIGSCSIRSPGGKKSIRMITFSNDGKTLLACGDDGKIFRFDRNEEFDADPTKS